MSEDILLDTRAVCERYKCCKSTEWRLRQQGKLPAGFKIGGKRFRRLKDLLDNESKHKEK